MKNKIKQKIAAVSSLILGLSFGLPNQPAQASANGCSYYGLNGKTCISVNGDSTNVNSVQGWFNFEYFGSQCNWFYKIQFYDKANKPYNPVTGPIHYSCDSYGTFTQAYNGKPYKAKEGRVCAEIHEIINKKDNYLDAACVNITK